MDSTYLGSQLMLTGCDPNTKHSNMTIFAQHRLYKYLPNKDLASEIVSLGFPCQFCPHLIKLAVFFSSPGLPGRAQHGRAVLFSVVQCSSLCVVQCSPSVQFSAVQFSVVSSVQFNAVHCSKVQSTLCSTVQCISVKCVQYACCSVFKSSVLGGSALQYSIVQFSVVGTDSRKAAGVVWTNLPQGGPEGNQTDYPRVLPWVNFQIIPKALPLLVRLQASKAEGNRSRRSCLNIFRVSGRVF